MEVRTNQIFVVTGESQESVQEQYHSYLNEANNNTEGKQYRAKDASISAYTEQGVKHYTLGFMLEEVPQEEAQVQPLAEGTNVDVVDNLLSGFHYEGGNINAE